MDQNLFQQLLQQEVNQMCSIALTEDLANLNHSKTSNPDITAELIQADKNATATLITREKGILCGVAWVEKIFELLGNQIIIDWHFQDGDSIEKNDILCHLSGNVRDLLTGERSAMNFLQSLSATATSTAYFVSLVDNPQCKLLDTRKTIPGMRFGQKYAVKCGGGSNHRIGLSDAFLIKENHILACGGIAPVLQIARQTHPDKLLEIEVENLDELQQALDGKAQVIMLDNFSLNHLVVAKKIRDEHSTNQAKLEASGNVSEATIKAIAATGVDYISVGALTKSINAMDLSMRIIFE